MGGHTLPCQTLFLLILLQGCTGTREHARLIHHLLGDYDPMVRPVEQQDTVITVSIRVTLHQIRDLDEKNQHLTTNVWLRFFWVDEFLRWNASDFSGISRLHILSSKIWRPDIVLYNSVDEERTAAELLSDTNIELSPDGLVSWTTPAMFKSACKIQIDSYPFDVQHCTLKFGSWTYNGFEVNVTTFKPEIFTDNLMPNGEWEILSAPCVRNEMYYSCCKEPFPDVTCTMVMRRRPLFYIYNLVVPCILLIFIGSLVFVLPPESGEKVSLAMTVLLAMTVFMLVVMENIPPTSEVVPLLEQFIGATIVLLTLSAVIAIFTVNCHYRGQGLQRPPKWLRRAILGYMSRCVNMKHQVQRETDTCRHKNRDVTKNNHTMSCNGRDQRNTGITDTSPLEMDELLPRMPSMQHLHNVVENRGTAIQATDILLRIHTRLDHITKVLTASREFKAEEEKANKEWRLVAMVLDRLFLIIFLSLVLFTFIAMFCQIPTK